MLDKICLNLKKALNDESVDPIAVPFFFLKAITKNFSSNQLIGSGGFGSVYMGELPNGTLVAVKKLRDTIGILEEGFQSEITCLIEAKHKNIVRFLGYCSETQQVLVKHEGKRVLADLRQRLLCLEYVSKGSLANYLTEPSSGLPWKTRYQIIKGICEGVGYLHQGPMPIIHMDLKPDNILLDDSMVPRIADFGISRRLSHNKSRTITKNIIGARPYLAPEFLGSGLITPKTDIYSLGVIIIEILMGCKQCPSVDEVLETWTNMFGTSENLSLLQVKVCAEIGINCMDDNPVNRPDIQHIISSLKEKDDIVRSVSSTSTWQSVDEADSTTASSALCQQERSALGRFYQQYRVAKKACKPTRINASKELLGETNTKLLSTRLSESEMLDIHPLELSFFFEAKKGARCPVNVTNMTDRYVTYWIIPHFPDMYRHIHHQNIMEPMSTGTSIVTMVCGEQPPLDAGMFDILIISMVNGNDLKDLASKIGKDPKIDDDLPKRVEELGGEVHAAILMAVVVSSSSPQRDIQRIAPKLKLKSRIGVRGIHQMDVHPTRPWILLCHDKYLYIWDYETQETIVKNEVQWEAGNIYPILCNKLMYFSIIFIPRMHWFVATVDGGYINVYSYITKKKIKVFKAGGSRVVSLAIHPSQPYLLSGCDDGVIEVWNWDRGWACSRKVYLFSDNSTQSWILVKFNPNDANTFTSRSNNGGLKVWSIHPPAQPITTIEQNYHVLYDHIFTEDGRNHVIIIPRRGLEIWDLQTRTLVRTLYAGGACTAVACHPTLPLIVVCLYVQHFRTTAIQFWSSTSYRLEKTYYLSEEFISNLSEESTITIRLLGFSGTKSVVLGTDEQIAILEIDMESLACQHVMPSQASGLPESSAEAAEGPRRRRPSVRYAGPEWL